LKVIQVIPTLSAGGAEGFITNLSVSLSAMGVDVTVFLLAGVRGERGNVLFERLNQAKVKVLGREERKAASFKNFYKLIALIRNEKPDLVQANLYAAEVACALVKFLLRGNKAKYVNRLANTELFGRRSKNIVKTINRFYDLTIACSETVKKSYIKNFKVYNVVAINNGGKLIAETPNTEDIVNARKKLGITKNAFTILHIGRMDSCGKANNESLESNQKAHDIILKAFKRAFGGDPEKILLLVGDGNLRPMLEGLTHSLELNENVIFLGQLPEPWDALKTADLFFFPSRYEGLPNVLPEAASCGLPVLASDIPEIRSMYSGKAWLLKPVDNVEAFMSGLKYMYENIAYFREQAMSEIPYFIKKYSMKDCALNYHKAYSDLLNNN
jgi:glycosyltransferase involved in cell wall biosynthesis